MTTSASPPTNHMPQVYSPRRPSDASSELALQQAVQARGARSSICLETLLSPTSADKSSLENSPEGRPPAKKLRVSVSPHPASEGWPPESMDSDSVVGSITSPPVVPQFCWTDDPYQLDPEVTIYYTNKYFSQIDSATSCILPRKAFLRWVRDCRSKSPRDIMLMYAILAMGTVFEPRPESKRLQTTFIEVANMALLKNGDTFSLQLVQAKLIMTLFAFSQGQYNQAWDYCGSALRVAFALKFHTEEGVAAFEDSAALDFGLNPATLKECRRRTFWSAYIMDCFNGCCSTAVASVVRSECSIRLPCSQPAYERSEIPATAFSLIPSRGEPDDDFKNRRDIQEVGVLGYLVEIATLFSEVVSRMAKNKPDVSKMDLAGSEAFHRDILRRLQAWDQLMKTTLHSGHAGTEPVDGLNILDHYTAMILHRYFQTSKASDAAIREHVQGAYEHARLLLEMVQRLSNDHGRGRASFRFATMSPFSGFAITAALDIITAAGTMADLMGHKSRIMSLVSSGVEALEGLVDFWHSARQQRDMIKRRLSILLDATTRPADIHGAFYFGQPMQSPAGMEQDVVYGLPRRQYFEALGWDDRIHPGGDFHRLD
jgi:hypothetical protein